MAVATIHLSFREGLLSLTHLHKYFLVPLISKDTQNADKCVVNGNTNCGRALLRLDKQRWQLKASNLLFPVIVLMLQNEDYDHFLTETI